MEKFYVCETCKNLIGVVQASGVPMVCCGKPMTLLNANTVDASQEKHTPAVKVNGDTVEVVVGDVLHPMLAEHYIQWIYLKTDKGGQIKYLKPEEAPAATFTLCGEKAVAVYEYCNLHGLWKTEL